MSGWIVIPNWDKFQHYRDRDPLWIKVYTRLQADEDWLNLTLPERGLLASIWLEYARANGQITTSNLHARLGQRVWNRHLQSLNEAGFIQFSASKPLALARARVETEKERDTPYPTADAAGDLECRKCGKPVKPLQTCPSCGASPRQAGTNPRAVGKVSETEKQRRKAKAWIDNVLPHLEGVDLAYTIADQFHIADQNIVADLISYAQERMVERG